MHFYYEDIIFFFEFAIVANFFFFFHQIFLTLYLLQLQTWIFTSFSYLINFNFVIYVYCILFSLHCLIIKFIWTFHFSQSFYKAKWWKNEGKKYKVLLCHVMIVLLCKTKYDAKHLQASKNLKRCKKNKDKIVKNTRVYVCFQNNL